MVLATVEGAGRAVVLCVAVVAGILYSTYRVLSIGRRGRGLPPGMVDLLCFASRQRWKSGEGDVCGTLADLRTNLGPRTVPVLGNEHQIPAADGHFL